MHRLVRGITVRRTTQFGHVCPRLAGISIVFSYSARSLAPVGLDWKIQTDGLNSYGNCLVYQSVLGILVRRAAV